MVVRVTVIEKIREKPAVTSKQQTVTQRTISDGPHLDRLGLYTSRYTPLLQNKHGAACINAFRPIAPLLELYTLVGLNQNSTLW